MRHQETSRDDSLALGSGACILGPQNHGGLRNTNTEGLGRLTLCSTRTTTSLTSRSRQPLPPPIAAGLCRCHQPPLLPLTLATITNHSDLSRHHRRSPLLAASPATNPSPLYWRPSSGLSHHHEVLPRMSKCLQIIVCLHSLLICAAIT